jgi:hypothetical protein
MLSPRNQITPRWNTARWQRRLGKRRGPRNRRSALPAPCSLFPIVGCLLTHGGRKALPRQGRFSSKCRAWRCPRRLLNPSRQGRNYISRNALGVLATSVVIRGLLNTNRGSTAPFCDVDYLASEFADWSRRPGNSAIDPTDFLSLRFLRRCDGGRLERILNGDSTPSH